MFALPWRSLLFELHQHLSSREREILSYLSVSSTGLTPWNSLISCIYISIGRACECVTIVKQVNFFCSTVRALILASRSHWAKLAFKMLPDFSALKSFFKLDPIKNDNDIFRLHYKATVLFLALFATLTSLKQYVGGKKLMHIVFFCFFFLIMLKCLFFNLRSHRLFCRCGSQVSR